MARNRLPPPNLALSRQEARALLLALQGLLPPRALSGKRGVLDHIRRVNAIQYDPINIVGRNPDLVLQARVADYRPAMLDELLYQDRQLLDGWDKMAAIMPVADRPYFARHRARMRAYYDRPSNAAYEAMPVVLDSIRSRGPLSSIDLKELGRVDWHWGRPAQTARAALESLNRMGELEIHHRIGTRRVFDLAERLLPPELVDGPDPNPTDEGYRKWHILRRVASQGVAGVNAGEHWSGIQGVKSPERTAVMAHLLEAGDLLAAEVEGFPGKTLVFRAADRGALDELRNQDPPRAAIIGPLDNLIWNRRLVDWLFDFQYVWEVYKPAAQRQYGYYVLPVLYGARFVARFQPALDKKSGLLTIDKWWWEPDVAVDEAMEAALIDCLGTFRRYLGATELELGEAVTAERSLAWLAQIGSFEPTGPGGRE